MIDAGKGKEQRHGWRRAILDLVDDIYDGGGGVPAGAFGRLFGALDLLRDERRAGAEVAHVQQVALTLHRLRDALRITGRASPEVMGLRRDLRRSTLAWMQDAPLFDFA